MRVLAILNSLELGGTQLNAVDHAHHLADRGVETTLVGFENSLPSTGPTLLDVAGERGLDVEVLPPQGTLMQTAPVLGEVADRSGAELVHAYSATQLRFGFWGPSRFGHRPLVMTMYEMAMPPYVPRRQHLIVGTKYLEEEQATERPGPTWLISPPVDLGRDEADVDITDFLRRHDLEDGGVRFVIVSRLDDSMKPRAVELAMQAIERLDHPDATLVVVGGGPSESRLRDTGDAVNDRLGRRAVIYTGSMTDPRPAYASADVTIGMGGSAARGLAFGKPLIVSGEVGWFRLFTPETAEALYRNSFWSDDTMADPVEALVDAMTAVVDDADRRDVLGAFGRRFAEENFSLPAMSERLLSVYRSALERPSRRAWFLDLSTEIRPAIANLRDRMPTRTPRR